MVHVKASIAILLASAAIAVSPVAAATVNPYPRLPAQGAEVRFDGSVGQEKFAWGFFNEYWLQTYLRFTIEAARNPSVYAKSQAAIVAIGQHSLVVPNGTPARVEEVKNFSYGGREDVQVRVMVQGGDLRGGEVWTTAGELVDSTGKSYLKP
jgi:hypothetical protein